MSKDSLDFFGRDIIEKKYPLLQQLASKRGNKTLLAKNLENQTLVAIKLYNFSNYFSWHDLKLLEQKAQTLQSLAHPSIPNYIDYFRVDTENTKGFALVQSYVEASSLETQIESGRIFTEATIKQIAKELLVALDYIHSLKPLIIHGDIKPSNILIGDRSGHNQGKTYLIDFSSIQNLVTDKSQTITTIGSYGYTPPEQFGGKIQPASDLYSLGMTLITAVTKQHPADLPETDLKIQFEELTNLSEGFTNWLKKTIEPSLNSRFTSAKQALEELEKCEDPQANRGNFFFSQPLKSKILLQRSDRSLEVMIPPVGFLKIQTIVTFLSLLLCLIPWLAIVFQWSQRIALGITVERSINMIAGFSICSFGIFFLVALLCKNLFSKKVLIIDDLNVILFKKIFGINYHNLFVDKREALSLIEKIVVERPNDNQCHLNLITDKTKCKLANDFDFPLADREINWLATEISNWLDLPLIENRINEYDFRQANFHEKKAHAYFLKGNYHKALERYALNIHFDNRSFNAYINRAIINLYIYDYQSAIEDCCAALSINPHSVEAYCVRGTAYYYLQNYRHAIGNLNTAIKKNIQYQEAYYYLAATYIAVDNYQTAIFTCNQILKINPRYYRGYQMRANAYFALLDYPHTIQDCTSAIKINSKFVEAYTARGLAYCYSGNWQKSLADFAKQTKLEPTAKSYFDLGSVQFMLEKDTRALNSFSYCLQIQPNLKFAYYARAIIYARLNERGLALQNFQKATELDASTTKKEDTENEHSYYFKGLAYYQLDRNFKKAISNLEKAQKIAKRHHYQALREKAIAKIEELNLKLKQKFSERKNLKT